MMVRFRFWVGTVRERRADSSLWCTAEEADESGLDAADIEVVMGQVRSPTRVV